MKIIVIDDNQQNLDTAKTALSQTKSQVELFDNASDGLERLTQGNADLVFTDLMFPAKDASDKLVSLYAEQIEKARAVLNQSRRWWSDGNYFVESGGWPVSFRCGSRWPDKDYTTALEQGFKTEQGYEKSFGTVLFDVARKTGLEAMLLSSMLRHSFVGEPDPDFRQLVLPIMIKFPELVVRERNRFSNLGMNSLYLKCNFNKQEQDKWLSALHNNLNPFASWEDKKQFLKAVKESKENPLTDVRANAQKIVLEIVGSYGEEKGADWELVSDVFKYSKSPDILFESVKKKGSFKLFDEKELAKITDLIGENLQSKKHLVKALNYYTEGYRRIQRSFQRNYNTQILAKQFLAEGLPDGQLSGGAIRYLADYASDGEVIHNRRTVLVSKGLRKNLLRKLDPPMRNSCLLEYANDELSIAKQGLDWQNADSNCLESLNEARGVYQEIDKMPEEDFDGLEKKLEKNIEDFKISKRILEKVKAEYIIKNKNSWPYTTLEKLVAFPKGTAIAYDLSQQISNSDGCKYYSGIAVHNGEKEIVIVPITCWRDRCATRFSGDYGVTQIVGCEDGKYVVEMQSPGNKMIMGVDFKQETSEILKSETIGYSGDYEVIPLNSKGAVFRGATLYTVDHNVY